MLESKEVEDRVMIVLEIRLRHSQLQTGCSSQFDLGNMGRTIGSRMVKRSQCQQW